MRPTLRVAPSDGDEVGAILHWLIRKAYWSHERGISQITGELQQRYVVSGIVLSQVLVHNDLLNVVDAFRSFDFQQTSRSCYPSVSVHLHKQSSFVEHKREKHQ